MKVRMCNGQGVEFEFEEDTQQAAFEALAKVQEVFDEKCCGVCKSTDLRYVVRTDKDENKYFELVCQNRDCRAKLAFGCNKKGGGLFPKRKGEDDRFDYKSLGWKRWEGGGAKPEGKSRQGKKEDDDSPDVPF